jgi:hypothetical protein
VKKRNCLEEGYNMACQYKDLATGGDVKLKRIEALEWRATILTWGIAIKAWTVFHWKPRNG